MVKRARVMSEKLAEADPEERHDVISEYLSPNL